MTTTYTIRDDPKMLRETLCLAQVALQRHAGMDVLNAHHIARIGRLITECDRHRPLGPNGKHGDRHTPTCGCDDVPLPTWAPSPAVVRAVFAEMDHLAEFPFGTAGQAGARHRKILAAALDVEEMARALYEATNTDRVRAVLSWDEMTRQAQGYWIAVATSQRESILGITP